MRRLILALAIASSLYAQDNFKSNPVTGALDIVGDLRFRSVGGGTLAARPATCNAGDVYYCTGAGCTAGQRLHYCPATNTWDAQGTAAGGGITSLGGLVGATQTFVNDTNVTMVSSGTTHTLTWASTLAKARQNAATVYTDAANAWSTGAQSMAAATSFIVPSAAGYAPTASGSFGYDSTAHRYVAGANGAGKIVPWSTDLTDQSVNGGFKSLVVAPTSDVITAAFRRQGAAQTANLVEFQTEANALLSAITKAGAFTGNAATATSATSATALAGNGTNCSAGQAALGVDASGNAEGCWTPAGSGDFSSNTSTSVDGEAVLFSGTGGKTGKRSTLTAAVVKSASGVYSGAAYTDVVGLWAAGSCSGYLKHDGTCATPGGGTVTHTAGALTLDAPVLGAGTDDIKVVTATAARTAILPAKTGNALKVIRVNAAETDYEVAAVSGTGDVVGPASATDNAVARFDTTTGKLIQNSGCTIDDSGNMTCNSFIASGTGPMEFTEIAAPGAPATANHHNVYFDSSDSKLKSQENAGSVKVYATEAGNVATATALAANGSNCTSGSFPLGVDASGAAESCTQATLPVSSGTATLGTSAIGSGACASVVTVAASGVATTDAIVFTPNADITAVTGYAPVTTGGLAIYPYPTANNVNFKVCNPTSSSITPGAVTLNWRVAR